MKIQSSEKIGHGPIRAVVYGQQGAGKTTLSKTLEGKTIVLSLENGLLSLQGSNVQFVDLTKDDEGRPFNSAVAKYKATIDAIKSPEVQAFDNVVLDSLTQFGLMVKLASEEQFANEIAKNKFFLYSKIAETTVWIINYINDTMKCNFIALCQESLDKDEESRMYYNPDYPGAASMGAILGLFDEVYRLTADVEGKRWLHTQPTNRIKAKSRGASGGLIKPIEPAHLGDIFKRIRGAQTKTETKGVTK